MRSALGRKSFVSSMSLWREVLRQALHHEQAKLQALSSGDSEFQKLHESATGGRARAKEEYMRVCLELLGG